MQELTHEERVARELARLDDEAVIRVRRIVQGVGVMTPELAEVYDARLRRRAKKAKGRRR